MPGLAAPRSSGAPMTGGRRRAPGRPRARRLSRLTLFVAEPAGTRREVAALDHSVDEAVGDRFGAGEEAVALAVGVDALELLAGVVGVQLVDAGPEGQDFTRVDLDVARLPLEPAGRLVDEDPAVREGKTLASRPARPE